MTVDGVRFNIARMSEEPNPHYLLKSKPGDFPGLLCFWHFQESGTAFRSSEGEPFTLQSQTGTLNVEVVEGAPLGGQALHLKEGQWLKLARANCPALNFHGRQPFTLLAWLRREQTKKPQCEFIAGMWNETAGGRQYGLFLNNNIWQQPDRICAHLSQVGGPTPGYKYCMDGAQGASVIELEQWSVIAMSYDGLQGTAWLNGQLDARPGLNPYPFSAGLHNGGEQGSDFTVGAVDRAGEMGNFFTGQLAGLALYDRALSPAEQYALAQL